MFIYFFLKYRRELENFKLLVISLDEGIVNGRI